MQHCTDHISCSICPRSFPMPHHYHEIMRTFLLLAVSTALMTIEVPLDPAAWDCPGWNTATWPEDGGGRPAMCVRTPTADWGSQLTHTVRYGEPVARITLSWDMRTSGVVGGSNAYEAARIQVQFLDGDGEQTGGWPACLALRDDHDWTPLSQELKAPADCRAIVLHLGMYLATGTAWYRDLRLVAWSSDGRELQPLTSNGERTTTTDWWPLQAAGTTPIALPLLRGWHRPAGRHGAVVSRDGRMVFADGTPTRFWGSGYVSWDVSESEMTAWLDRLTSMGVTMVRLHGLESAVHGANLFRADDTTSMIDPIRLQRLQRYVSACRERGIYIFFDVLVGWKFRPGDGVRDYEALSRSLAGRPACWFDERIITLTEDWLRTVLTTPDPRSGRRLADDPAIALVGLVNENSVFEPLPWRNLPASYQEEARKRFTTWAMAAKTTARDGSIADLLERGDPDVRSFLTSMQGAYLSRMTAHVRSLGCNALVTGTNWMAHAPEMAASAKLGFVDRHGYWDHPQNGWDPTSSFNAKSLAAGPSLLVDLARLRVDGSPYTISEWNCVWPNPWTAEGGPMMAAMAGYQGHDAVLVFGVNGSGWKPAMAACFPIDDKPTTLIPWLAAGIAYRRGDVRPGPQLVFPFDASSKADPSAVIPATAALTHRVALHAGAPAPSVPAASAGGLDPVRGALAADGQYRWQDDRFVLDTPLTQAVVGVIGSSIVRTADLSLTSRTPWLSLTATSLDDQPLSRSSRILVAVVARAENTGQVWRPFRRGLREVGGAPILIEPVHAELVMRRGDSAHPLAYALDADGRRTGARIEPVPEAGSWRFRFSGQAALWFEVVTP